MFVSLCRLLRRQSTSLTSMNLDDKPTVQPPDSSKLIDDDVEKEKTAKKKTTTFNTFNNIPPSVVSMVSF